MTATLVAVENALILEADDPAPPDDPAACELFAVRHVPGYRGPFIVKENGTAIVYAHEGQQAAYEAHQRFVLILAGTRGGKSAIGPWWLLKTMQAMGPGEYLCAAPSYPIFKKGIYKPLRRAFVRELKLGRVIGGHTGEFRFSVEGFKRLWPGYEYDEDAKVVFAHAANPDSLEAAEYKAAWLDEPGQRAFPVDSWEAIQRRLAIDRGPCLMTTTPYVVAHWIKEQIHDPAKRGDADYRVVSFKSTMNPTFSQDEYERAKSVLPAWKHQLFYDGEFSRPAGAVYDCWEPDAMTEPPFVPDPTWKRYVGVDFGAPNFVALFIAEEPGAVQEVDGPMRRGSKGKLIVNHPGTLHVYAEYAPNEARSAREHVAAMRQLRVDIEGENHPPLSQCVGGSFSENQWRLDFGAEGWPISQPDQPDVERGIDRVYARIKTDHLRVSATCPRLLSDLANYSRPVDEAGNVLEGLEDAHAAHAADSLRYIVTWLDRTGVDFAIKFI